jgi:hypothetical protein
VRKRNHTRTVWVHHTSVMRTIPYRGDGPFTRVHGWGRQIIGDRWRYIRRMYLTGKRYGPFGEWVKQVTPWRTFGEGTDKRRNGQGARTRKIRSTWQRIVELLPGGMERVSESFAKGMHAILEDVL